ncbi:hypothetical protein AUJ14_03460 [Candidatus Micrarchaeota archaeon CG1_02_55_22]|nr:MAG: hypothetical protein AUJ14_03460 [Candidatus Micrarchaeota archaeon CG1_02_55_22]
MRLADKLVLSAVVLASLLLFFATALSELDNYVKFLAIIGIMTLSGAYIKRVTGSWGRFGVVMLRGKNGLDLMKSLGDRYPEAFRKLADFGLTLCFGIPYGYYVFRKEPKKLLIHSLILAVFALGLHFTPLVTAVPWADELVLGVVLLFGLAGIGLLSLFASAISIFASKAAAPGVAPLVPGVTVPYEAAVAMVIILIVHEVAHGILARIERVKVRSSGIVLWGVLPVGAFVEPDEKALGKADLMKKRRVLIAGSASNFYFFLLFAVITLAFSLLAPLLAGGVAIASVQAGSPALGLLHSGEPVIAINGTLISSASDVLPYYLAGGPVLIDNGSATKLVQPSSLVVRDVEAPSFGILKQGDVLKTVDGEKVYSSDGLRAALKGKEGVAIGLLRDGEAENVSVYLDNGGRLGITVIQQPSFAVNTVAKPGLAWPFALYILLFSILTFTALLNFALAVVNVLPLFITDGHQILQAELIEAFGKKRGIAVSLAVGAIALVLILINLARWFKVL